MKNIRKFYGETKIKIDDWKYKNQFNEFIVKYYRLENKYNTKGNLKFGVEIVKIIKFKNDEIIEKKIIENLHDTEEKIDKLLHILVKNKVTPIELEDILQDFKFTY